ncbi:hypothetical protein VSS37_05980 [Candidatus Thiothrix sp. Deng01]|uniref:Uncharacterized protein n=1 Tax=Candidatus Thiothrix phosphatis TaxID=3112415 RepID=A0ABU6CUL8_9GAMM|nr:hypothetical protein [Candidatus Thiothrix sp. Deng01]MEB4590521.1 hypothetical protein [Candidatus Thiothrix sp. Deng01]
MAFGVGNLLSVGQTIRAHHQGAELIFAADNDVGKFIKFDKERIENPGVYYASKAADAVGAGIIIPPKNGDWNDWHKSLIVDKKKPDHF